MTHGRKVCNTLKEIRRQIADKNEIEYTTDDCHFEGECKGTCPKCDAEVKYLEKELHRRTQLGKTAVIAGISLGIAGTFPACNAPQQTNTPVAEQEIAADTVNLDTIPVIPKDSVRFPDIVFDGFVVPEKEEMPYPNQDTIKPDEYEWFDGLFEEINPEFPGGEDARIKFLQENTVYPEEAKEQGIEGRVMIGFIVEKDGSLSNIEVIRGVHPLLDEEALRVVKTMPDWKPSYSMGKTIRIRYRMPVTFKLNDE
ncbi:MAG: energy transducer TonB [Lentimicrobiaceae bacterium]|nr:energy transducer TonB [Lentimicrobiaceae bacterium]